MSAPQSVPSASSTDTPHAPYIPVFLALLILTLLEYAYALGANRLGFPFVLLVLGLVVLALTKAALVALFFMHVKYEGRWVYLLIVPTVIMATIIVLALYPDIGITRTPPTKPRADDNGRQASSGLGGRGWVVAVASPSPYTDLQRIRPKASVAGERSS